MSKHTNPALIGAFVVGAIFLGLLAFAYLGSFKFNDQSREFVLFFDESVHGLDIGSRVKYRGVTIGKVKQVLIRLPSQPRESPHIPVIVEIDPQLMEELGVTIEQSGIAADAQFKKNIESGLRGQLQIESLITGLSYIEIDIKQQVAPPILIQDPKNVLYKEIPTTPSPFATLGQSADQIFARMAAIDWESLTYNIVRTTENLRKITEEMELKEITENLNSTLTAIKNRVSDPHIDTLLSKLDEMVSTIRERVKDSRIDESFEKFNSSLDHFHLLTSNLNAEIDPLSDEFKQIVKQFKTTLTNANSTLNQIQSVGKSAQLLLNLDSSLQIRIDEALVEFTRAAKSVERLTDSLERNPKSLITGKAK